MLSKEYQSGPNVVYYVYWRRSRNGETNLEFQSVCLINIFIIKIIQINVWESNQLKMTCIYKQAPGNSALWFTLTYV